MREQPQITITEHEFRKLPVKEQNVIIFRSITQNTEATIGVKRTVRSHTYILSVLSAGLGFTIATFVQHLMK